MTTESDTGRVNQKKRTRMAILHACRELIRSGVTVTMPDVAQLALVSEATAYRYFPDLASLVNEAFAGMWPSPAEALGPVADSGDPVERVAFACEFLLRGVLSSQAAVRAMISATILRPSWRRPGRAFGSASSTRRWPRWPAPGGTPTPRGSASSGKTSPRWSARKPSSR